MAAEVEVDTASRLTSIDLFAGAGGLTEGLESAGFASLYANEWIPQYAQTYALNHPNVIVDSADIRKVDAGVVRRRLGLEKGELDLVSGGPPCQGFSINAPKRSGDDYRNHLFVDFLRFVNEFMPKAVLIENVPGMVSFDGGGTLDAILSSLSSLGYGADVRVLYAPHFGVPQTRWRTLILGVRDGDLPPTAFPHPLRTAPRRVNFTSRWRGKDLIQENIAVGLPEHTNVWDAIGDLPALRAGEEFPEYGGYRTEPSSEYQRRLRVGTPGVLNHQAPRLGKKNLDRLSFIPMGGNWTDIPFDLLPAGMRRARPTDHTKRYGRASWDGLSSTILTKCDPHWGAFFHPEQDRSFTVREAARIQSFPDSYQFTGSRVDQFAQVGNAVPPMLAEAVGRSLGSLIRSLDNIR